MAGKVGQYLEQWSQLTSDKWVLQTVKGCKLEFDNLPEQANEPSQINFTVEEIDIIDNELSKLLHKGVIEFAHPEPGQFVSNIFIREKKDHTFRMILNLKKLNQNIEYHHFKMDSLKTAINLMHKNCWFASLDLKDAYYSIGIEQSHRKYLRFRWKGVLYQYTCLANGLSPAPRIWTKVLKPVFSHLRKLGYTNCGFIDDSLLLGDTYVDCEENVEASCSLMDQLGLTIHPDKSVFIPVQIIVYLGFVLNSIDMTVRLTSEKASGLKLHCEMLLSNTTCTIRQMAELVGKFVASEPGVQYATLFYKRTEGEKDRALKLSRGNFEAKMNISQTIKEDLQWWIDNIEQSVNFVRHTNPDIILQSDSSMTGWGGVRGPQKTGGFWSQAESLHHINYLELKAAFLTLQSLCKFDRGLHVQFQLDNTTAVAYVNKMGGKKPLCNSVARDMWLWAKDRSIWLSASHLPGSCNVEADQESRKKNQDSEWMLNKMIFKQIEKMYGPFDIDLFASRINYQFKPYIAWRPDPEAYAIDAFTVRWNFNLCYMFPPFSVIGRVLHKVEEDQVEAVLVAPAWHTQAWFPQLLKLLVDTPRIIQKGLHTLHLPSDMSRNHPLARNLTLCLFRLSGNPSRSEAFLKTLPPSLCTHGEKGQKYNIKHILKNGYSFVLKGRLIHFMPL